MTKHNAQPLLGYSTKLKLYGHKANQKANQSLKLHLIVDHHMNRAMCGVRWQVRQVKRLIHNTLACKRSVTVKQNRHHL